MDVKIKKLVDNAILPAYKTAGSGGADLCAAILMPLMIRPGECKLIPTGIAMSIPENYIGAVYPRSGLATKNGLRLANCVGVIDSDYRGEIGVPIYNDSSEDQVIYPQERIAQIVFHPVAVADWIACESLDYTERGESGFGSTGTK